MHYYIIGINGSGKTTLLNAISAQTGIAAVQGTQELMKTLGIANDYDALRNMDQSDVLVKWGETAKRLLEAYGNTPFLLDTHILNLANGKIIRRDGAWIADYDALVMVKANPATILARIDHDTKNRALFTLDFDKSAKLALLTEYQEMSEKLFHELAKKYNLPSKVIQNDVLDKAVASFLEFNASLR